MWWYLAVIIIAAFNAVIFAKYITATVESKAAMAAAFDLMIMLSSSAVYQLWSIMHYNFWVLIIGDLSSALGTYVWLKYNARQTH
jgi:hypothetical protein